ncbi:MAG: helix-turn-helix transcriptional regulator [Acidimicrobiales bacterium]|jgi:DNA-binding transcriptional regulator YiaG
MSSDYDALEEVYARRCLPAHHRRKEIREAAGLSLLKVGDHLGVSAQAVGYWESGRSEPRGENLYRYLEFLRDLGRLSEVVR